jgi:hypothetical protein
MNRMLALTLSLLAGTVARAAEPAVQVIVAAVDIPAGTKVTIEMISQRALAKRFATSSIVKPDSASYLLNQPTKRAMLQGDLVLWSSFDADVRIIEACEKKFSGDRAADAAEQVRRARAAIIKK